MEDEERIKRVGLDAHIELIKILRSKLKYGDLNTQGMLKGK